ncbi:hypothetical protein ACF0H5_009243 [Mactra antiquata]
MKTYIDLLFCLISTVTSTVFHPKYGKPRPPYGSPLVPHGIRGRPFGRGPVSRVLPLIPPPFPINVLWKTKMDPRTGNFYKIMQRKALSPDTFNHFSRKSHYARKIHKMTKPRLMSRLNPIGGGILGMRRQLDIQDSISCMNRPHVKGHPKRMIPLISRPQFFPHVVPQLQRRPNKSQSPFNAVSTPPRLNCS